MEQLTSEVAIQLIPAVLDILDFQVTGQQVLIKPAIVETVKTPSGLIIPETQETGMIKNNLLKKGTVVSKGSRVSDEITIGLIVYYYNRSVSAMIRQDDDLYKVLQEYDIVAYIKP